MNPSRYLLIILLPTVLVLAAVGGFNATVDPFGLLGAGTPGFNDQKMAAYNMDRMHKTHAISRLQPDIVYLGTSRVGMGLNADHEHFTGQTVYNVGMTGATMFETKRYYQHAQAVGTVDTVLLGLDFFSFDAVGRPPATYLDSRIRVHQSNALQLSSFYVDWPPALWSMDATEASLQTIEHSQAVAAGTMPPVAAFIDGRFDDALWEPKLAASFEQGGGGHNVQFWLREKDFLWAFIDFRYRDRRGDNIQLEHYRNLLRQLHHDGVSSHLFIPPIHARMMLVIESSGLWDDFADWKRDLVRINEAVAAELKTEPFILWDFTGFNPLTTEVVPPFGDTEARMRWFWEGSHFRRQLGDVLIDRMFARANPDGHALFGLPISEATIDAHLEQQIERRETWKATIPALVDDIAHRVKILRALKTGEFDLSVFTQEEIDEVNRLMGILQGN